MRVQIRNVYLLHASIKILQNELAKNNEIIMFPMEIQSTVLYSLLAPRNDPTISDLHHQ